MVCVDKLPIGPTDVEPQQAMTLPVARTIGDRHGMWQPAVSIRRWK
jgi:hypothetical protein